MKQIKRSFYPGSEWLYIKIYAGVGTCDELITDVLYKLSHKLERMGMISKWFFIRYSDPDFHLRYRLLLTDKSKMSDIISMLNTKLSKYILNHLVYRVSIDTYTREIERYGMSVMEDTETLFYENSKQISLLLGTIRATNENYRWMSAFLLIDSFLESLGLTLEEKHTMMEHLNNSYCREFGFGLHNSKQLNTMYRDRKKLIEQTLRHEFSNSDFAPIYKLTGKFPVLKPSVARSLNKPSCVHMMMNRLFSSKNRLHELLVYNFMNRYYKSCMARNAQIKDKPN